MIWRCRERVYDFADGPLVMGIVNVTPDSFSDGGEFLEPRAALTRIRSLEAEGADLIDLGAESTRPGAQPVPATEQLRRLDPVLAALGGHRPWALSVDTMSAEVADSVLRRGADVINDVSGLSDPAMAATVARHGAGLVIMHMQGDPQTMQLDPHYHDVTAEVRRLLQGAMDEARRILTERIADLHTLAKALLEYETLTGEEIKALMDGGTIDRGGPAGPAIPTAGTSIPKSRRPRGGIGGPAAAGA